MKYAGKWLTFVVYLIFKSIPLVRISVNWIDKGKYPDHLVIIQNGCFYEVIDEDVAFFEDSVSYNSFERFNNLVTGFPIFSEKVLPELRDMKKCFVLVSQ